MATPQSIRRPLLLWLIVIIVVLLTSGVHGFVPYSARRISPSFSKIDDGQQASRLHQTRTTGSGFDEEEAERLKESAKRLREEVEALEAQLGTNRSSIPTTATEGTTTRIKPAQYTSLQDSVWSTNYRFSSDPPPRDDDDNNKQPPSQQFQQPDLSNYSGKLILRFRSDGYTDLLTQESTGMERLTFRKVWGWDQEVSNEDGFTYIVFSASVELPSSDAASPNEVVRYYWQARIDTAPSGILSLEDGTITVKKDIEPPGGFWGFFNGRGILAQFRFVGNYIAKPTTPPPLPISTAEE